MPPSTHLEASVHFTRIVAASAKELGDSAEIPFLRTAGVLTDSILNSVQSLRSNMDEGTRMVKQIREIFSAVIRSCSTAASEGMIPPALGYDLARFTE
ncbi:hypothetical protein C8R43DRAFT_1239805 [Mycena crocata]|nr:hypothetical protein C8R43DRAFT_1239805 [Mycena crocata]